MNTWRRTSANQAWLGWVVFCLLAGATMAQAAGTTAPAIAVAVTMGQVEVNNVKAEGGVNVPDGALVKTRDSAARLQFRTGARATLGTESQAVVSTTKITLQSGSGLVNGANPLTLEALGFQIRPQSPGSSALVEHKGHFIQVSAVAGSVSVFNMDGTPLARVETGRPLTFEPAGLLRMAPDEKVPDDGNTNSKKQSSTKQAARHGLTHGAKVGIGVGVAAGVGLGVALPMAVLSR